MPIGLDTYRNTLYQYETIEARYENLWPPIRIVTLNGYKNSLYSFSFTIDRLQNNKSTTSSFMNSN
jgi:hypothetical protein